MQRQACRHALRSQAKVAVHLTAPPVCRAQGGADGTLFKSPATAPVTLGECSDLHGPCGTRVVPPLAQLASQYGDHVKFVLRDSLINQLHPGARPAHAAARCTSAQGRGWASHDALCAHAPKTAPEQLKASAQEVGLDLPAFEQCLSSGKYQAIVPHDIDEGTRVGVTGTPACCITGRLVSGAQPLESFTRVIEEELARAR